MNGTSLIIGLITGLIGMGYFSYGKKQGKSIPMFAGGALCVVPYFFENNLILAAVCLVLIAAPFIFRY